MVMDNIYYVSKSSDTSADTLLAVGFASYIGDIYREIHGTIDGIFIRDMGSCYVIQLPQPLGEIHRLNLSAITIISPFSTSKQREKLAQKGMNSEMIAGFDYDAEMEKSQIYRARMKELPRHLQTPEAIWKYAPELASFNLPEPADTRLSHYQAINMMKIASTFNELVQRWMDLTESQKQLHLALLLNLFSEPENDVAVAIAAWQKLAKEENIKGKALVSALQIINPTTGKGANRARAGELTIGNQDSFWLLELLKFRGFMDAAAPLVVKESKDRKTYVLQPKEIELDRLQATMHTLRKVLWPSTVIKLDILASLRLAQIFVDQYKSRFEQNATLQKFRRHKITSIAQGFEVTFYKDLGSAYATMNVSDLHLPEWLPSMENAEAVSDAEALLDEHVNVIQHIRNHKGEEGAEEYELLRFYRDFLSGNDLRPFWKFTTAYSGYLMSALVSNRYTPQLTTHGLEKLLMASKQEYDLPLTEIISNQGFNRIAYAIRQSTVTAQYRWSQQNDRTYEVRYGLGQDLMRKAHHRDDFLCALSQFLLNYNAETAREEEKAARDIASKTGKSLYPLTSEERSKRKLRLPVATEHIDEIAKLIDRSGSPELIGSLLVAYGYARDTFLSPRSEHPNADPQESQIEIEQEGI
jgi:hypothetical protein